MSNEHEKHLIFTLLGLTSIQKTGDEVITFAGQQQRAVNVKDFQL